MRVRHGDVKRRPLDSFRNHCSAFALHVLLRSLLALPSSLIPLIGSGEASTLSLDDGGPKLTVLEYNYSTIGGMRMRIEKTGRNPSQRKEERKMEIRIVRKDLICADDEWDMPPPLSTWRSMVR